MSDPVVKEPVLPDTFKVTVGAYLVGDNKTLFTFKNHNGVSTSLDLQNIFNMKTTATSITAGGYYRFTPYHRIEFGYGGVRSSSDIVFGEDTGDIDLSGGVETHLNISVMKLIYTYSFYHNEDVELGLGIGIHRTRLDYELTASLGENGKDHGFSVVIAPPIPVLGIRVHYNISKPWSLEYRLDAMSLASKINSYNTPNIKAVSGYITDQTIATEYQFIDNMSIGGGLNYNKMSVDFIKEEYDIGLENDVFGVNLFVSVVF